MSAGRPMPSSSSTTAPDPSAQGVEAVRQTTATLRLQLHAGYTLDDARHDLPYFARLGISHLYLSPVSQAAEGSTHGYDVIDHTRVDTARGGEEALRRLAAAAHRAGIGILLDIVPNHMATDPANAWWRDVLTHGRDSARASWFDIDWEAPGLEGKVLAPFLEKPYGEALREGIIRLGRSEDGELQLLVHGAAWPLAPGSLEDTGDDAVLAAHDHETDAGRMRLHELLERQHYRLAWWRCAADIINWRRFFEVSGLIGVRVELDEVFEAVHALPLRLYAEGIVDGLRIDHVDGLAQPLAYCRRLRQAMQAVSSRRPAGVPPGPPWIVVEKILAPGETLDPRWAVDGTSGYDFAADVGALQHDAAGAEPLFQAWARVAGDDRPAAAWLLEAREQILTRHFAAERSGLVDALVRLAQARFQTRDWTRPAIGRALDALVQHYPTYRSYVEDAPRAEADQHWFSRAEAGARASAHGGDRLHGALLTQLAQWLGGEAPASAQATEAVRRFQQLTPPLAAKSLEDTVFYRYGRLLSRNEVGSDPAVFAMEVSDFHEQNLARAAGAPRGLLATATHDHKRGEDSRARLAVISEMPDAWVEASSGWLASPGDPQEVEPNVRAFRYMLLQALFAGWPPDLSASDEKSVTAYLDRVEQWAIKAMREGKLLSGWFEPDTRREEESIAYLRSMAPGGRRHGVLQGIESFVRRIEPAAIANGLVQAALRMTCPGIPDLYQGTEFRDFSLVDPDNRRPVDYLARDEALTQAEAAQRAVQSILVDDSAHVVPEGPEVGAPAGLEGTLPALASGRWPAPAWADGRVKQALVASLLRLRRARPTAFAGDYQPLQIHGEAGRLVAFSREDEVVVIAAVKCVSHVRLDDGGMPVLPKGYWGDACVMLPPAEGWYDVLRGTHIAAAPRTRIDPLIAGFPLAVLCRVDSHRK